MLEWLRALPREDRHTVGIDLMRVQVGWPIGMPLVRSLGDGLWEIRSSLPSQRIARLLLPSGNDCRSSWIHQENAEDAARRSGTGEETKERSDRMTIQNPHIGSSLDEFLREEGILEEARSIAVKEVLAWQVEQAMKREKITKAEMARRMHTSRAALDRLLDPKNVSVTLQTLFRAAHAVGSDLRIELR